MNHHDADDDGRDHHDLSVADIDPQRVIRVVGAVVFVIFLLAVLSSTLGTIGAGERGVLLRFGGVTGTVKAEGLYAKFPFIEKIIKIPVQVLKIDTKASAASSDLQTVTAEIAVNYHVEPSSVAKIYQTYRLDFEDRIINPGIQEAVKAATAQFTAEQLITKRPAVRDAIESNLRAKIEPDGFHVDGVNIINFDFSPSFNQAIEAKVTAEQNALAAKNKLEQSKYEAQQQIAQAQGNAQSLTIEGEALRENPQTLQLRAIEKWNGILPTVTSGAIPFINIQK